MGDRRDNLEPGSLPAERRDSSPERRVQDARVVPRPDIPDMPRPEFLSLTYTLPYHLIEQIGIAARSTNRSPSEIIAESVRLYLKAWEARQEHTRISTVEGFSYQQMAVADTRVEDLPGAPADAAPMPDDSEETAPTSAPDPEPREEVAASTPATVPDDAPQIDETSGDAGTAQHDGDAGGADEVVIDVDTETADEEDVESSADEEDVETPADEDVEAPADEEDVDTSAADDGETEPSATDEKESADAETEEDVTARSLEPDDEDALLEIADPAADVRRRLRDVANERLDSDRLTQCLEEIMQQVDSKDFSPPEHSIKVAAMARELAAAKGLRGKRLQEVYVAGLVHDIGKACIPDEIIKKPKPSSDEMALIRKYPEFGVDLLAVIPAMEPIVEVVAAHQERWNGTGYPLGAERNEIPMTAQIVALCDVYDVLKTARRYRPAYSEERALQIIKQNVGALWNPDVARLFLAQISGEGQKTAAGARR